MNRNLVEPLRRDYESELVDPVKAADELINYAISLRQDVLNGTLDRLSLSARMLLDTLDDPSEGLDVIYDTFRRYKPRRKDIDDMVEEMDKESRIEVSSSVSDLKEAS